MAIAIPDIRDARDATRDPDYRRACDSIVARVSRVRLEFIMLENGEIKETPDIYGREKRLLEEGGGARGRGALDNIAMSMLTSFIILRYETKASRSAQIAKHT